MAQKIIDALIIGGGHNGLVCAFYLAKKLVLMFISMKSDLLSVELL